MISTKMNHLPAVEAEDNMTVWNHVGKKYVTERLHTATSALLMPTRTGTFWHRRYGGRMGSTAT